jgi:hypothetical protein
LIISYSDLSNLWVDKPADASKFVFLPGVQQN